ncbi:MAG: hypothetical protein K0U84_18445 [Actinomycetia bacterium]|nr:hypothetical protein [Actinomycetes bacterium]
MATWDLVKKEALAWSRATDALSTADAAAQAASLPLLLPTGQHVIDANLTIDSPVWFPPGSVLKPDDGITVTLAGGVVNAPMSQIFDHSAGGVVAPQNTSVFPEWWGAVGDGTTDDGAALVAMFQESPAAGGSGNIVVPDGKVYATSEAFEVQSNSDITGHGTIKCTQNTPGGRGAIVLMVNGAQNIRWVGPTIDGNGTENANCIAIGTGIGFDAETTPWNDNIYIDATVKGARISESIEASNEILYSGGGKGFTIQHRTRNVYANIRAIDCDIAGSVEGASADDKYVQNIVVDLQATDAHRTALFLGGALEPGLGSTVSARYSHSLYPGTRVRLYAMGGQDASVVVGESTDDNWDHAGVVTSQFASGVHLEVYAAVENRATLIRGKMFASHVKIDAYMDDLQHVWDARVIESTASVGTNMLDNVIEANVHAETHSGNLITLTENAAEVRRSVINIDTWCEDGVGDILSSAGTEAFGPSVVYRFRDVAASPVSEMSGNTAIEPHPTWALAPSGAGQIARQAYAVIPDGDTTPTVSNGSVSLLRTNNSSPTTITDLDHGREGQVVAIRFGDANTTVAHGGSTTIRLQDATNHTFASAETLTLVFDGTGWVEIARSSTVAATAYTPTNVSTDRAFDADTVAVAELADVVGTLIADLQAKRIIG